MTTIITGASRGIGRALLDAFVARGETAIGTYRGEKPDAAGEWRRADMADPSSIAALGAAQGGAPLDLLVCNAGVNHGKGQHLEDGFPPEQWAETFAVNVTGVFLTIQAHLPALRAGKGKIAIISSQMASSTNAGGGHYIYRASKAAALNLGRNLATDLKGDGIAVGIYHPGWVRTDMGGAGASIGTEEAARGLLQRFDALSLASTGCFETWDGRAHPY